MGLKQKDLLASQEEARRDLFRHSGEIVMSEIAIGISLEKEKVSAGHTIKFQPHYRAADVCRYIPE